MEVDEKHFLKQYYNTKAVHNICPIKSHKSALVMNAEKGEGCHNCQKSGSSAKGISGIKCKTCEYICCDSCLPSPQTVHKLICSKPSWMFYRFCDLTKCFYCKNNKSGVAECMNCKLTICSSCEIEMKVYTSD